MYSRLLRVSLLRSGSLPVTGYVYRGSHPGEHPKLPPAQRPSVTVAGGAGLPAQGSDLRHLHPHDAAQGHCLRGGRGQEKCPEEAHTPACISRVPAGPRAPFLILGLQPASSPRQGHAQHSRPVSYELGWARVDQQERGTQKSASHATSATSLSTHLCSSSLRGS